MDELWVIKHREIAIQKNQFRYLRNKLDEAELYRGDPRLLMYVSLHDGQSQNQIAKSLCVKPASLTVMIQRMELAGLVERKTDEKDQRIQRVFITEQGRMISGKTVEIFKKTVSEFYKGISQEELEAYQQVLKKIEKNVSNMLETNA